MIPFSVWQDDDSEESLDEETQLSSQPGARRLSRTISGQNGGGTCVALKGMFSNWITVLLVFVPIAWVLHIIGHGVQPIWNFLTNIGAIIPLSWIISESTEHLEKVVGPMWGTLLNSTFGNVVEILMSLQALRIGLVKVVQSSLLGAILMNLTGVLGLCVMAVGIKHWSATFNFNLAIYNLGLLSVACLGLVVPTGLSYYDDWSRPEEMETLSRWVAGMLLFMYIQWLIFNLCSHSHLFTGMTEEKKDHESYWEKEASLRKHELKGDLLKKTTTISMSEPGYLIPLATDEEPSVLQVEKVTSVVDAGNEDEEDEPVIAAPCACVMLLVATVLVAFHCEFLVDSIEGVQEEFSIKKAFIATVILPMVGNFSEVIAAVSIACKGKIDLAMGVAIGSATQIALCVIPISVFIGMAYGQNMDLDFELYQVKLMTVSITVVILLMLDGRANWLKGSLLVTVYLILCSGFWFMHDREFSSEGESPRYSSQIQSLNDSIAELNQTLANLTDKIIANVEPNT